MLPLIVCCISPYWHGCVICASELCMHGVRQFYILYLRFVVSARTNHTIPVRYRVWYRINTIMYQYGYCNRFCRPWSYWYMFGTPQYCKPWIVEIVNSTDDCIRENHLNWFGHATWLEAGPMRVPEINIEKLAKRREIDRGNWACEIYMEDFYLYIYTKNNIWWLKE